MLQAVLIMIGKVFLWSKNANAGRNSHDFAKSSNYNKWLKFTTKSTITTPPYIHI